MSRLVGPGKAMEYILRGKTFYPTEALECGLVNEVVAGDVLEAALLMAKEFDDKPPRALAAIKQAVKASWGANTMEGVLEEGDLFADLIATDDRAVENDGGLCLQRTLFQKNLAALFSRLVDLSLAKFAQNIVFGLGRCKRVLVFRGRIS